MKVKILTVMLLCALLWNLTGCGGAEGIEETAENGSRENAGGTENTESAGSTENAEGTQLPAALRQMVLLEFEDGDSENLAGLLQKNGSGMMVQLQAGNLLGSGVICGAEEDVLLILTAAHVLEDAGDSVLVSFADGTGVSSDDFECFSSGDFALVRVPAKDIPADTLEQCLCANIDKESFDAATAGTGCIVMGSRTGVAAEAYEGVILDHWIYMEDYGQYMMWVRAEGMQGMSGGGLFDRQGHFLGILSGENEDGELAVVPLSLILGEVRLLIF